VIFAIRQVKLLETTLNSNQGCLKIIDTFRNRNRTKREIAKLSSKFKIIIRLLRQLHLGKNTRFARKTSDFYSLFKAFMDLHNGKIIFNSRNGFAKASKELTTFSAEVAGIAEAFTNKRFAYFKKRTNTPFYKYWSTTQSGTDSKEHRDIRTETLKGIISRSFNSGKDKKRFFTVNQREQVWDASKDKNCSSLCANNSETPAYL